MCKPSFRCAQMLRSAQRSLENAPFVVHCFLYHLIARFQHDVQASGCKRNGGIGVRGDRLDQIAIQRKLRATQVGKNDQFGSLLCFSRTNGRFFRPRGMPPAKASACPGRRDPSPPGCFAFGLRLPARRVLAAPLPGIFARRASAALFPGVFARRFSGALLLSASGSQAPPAPNRKR